MISIINAGIKTMLGDGSAGNPYQIRTAAQLANIASLVNSADVNFNAKYYIQTADISLAAYNNWTPIGGVTNRFYGVYDGNGFGIYALNTSQNRAGLFGTIENATVKNVAIVCTAGCTVTGTGNTAWVGGIAAIAIGNSIISGCTNTATVVNYGNSGNTFVGGIVGYANTEATFGVYDCANFGAVQQNATTVGSKNGGGICGKKATNAVVTQCFNAGAVTTVSGTIYAILGNNATVVTCFYDSDTSLAGGQTGATGRTTADCQGTDALTNAGKLNNLGTVNWFARQGYPLPIRFKK